MLGAGQRGAMRPEMALRVKRLNGMNRPIVSCDVPTGYDDETGLRADHIVFMQCQKQLLNVTIKHPSRWQI